MAKNRKKVSFHYRRIVQWLRVTKRHSLKDLRRLIDKKISKYMKPEGDWIFLVNGVKVGKKQEENEMLWRDIIEKGAKVELIEKIPTSSLKRKSPPKQQKDEDSDFVPEDVKEDLDSDFEENLETNTKSSRKKTKRTDPATVSPDRMPSNDRATTPEHTNSGTLEGAVTPEHTNSATEALPETPPSNQNIVQGTEESSNGQAEAGSSPSAKAKPFKIKEEETRKKFATKRQKKFAKYGGKFLLHSQHPMGMPRLGGNTRTTFVVPRENHPVLFTSEYPRPLHIVGMKERDIHREDFGYMAFNTAWQPNGPMYAGQKSAAVRRVPKYFKKTRHPFAIFMKRTLTTKDHEREGSLLGWEYVGHYRYAPLDPDDESAGFYESAKSISKASKREIARKCFQSYQKEKGWNVEFIEGWRNRLIKEIEAKCVALTFRRDFYREEGWRKRLVEALEKKKQEHSLAYRCLEKGFNPDMSGEELSYLLVELDEYHNQDLIEFVHYDERVYEYCLGGKTNNTKDGKSISGGADGEPAKAQDWYDFATINMLFKY